MSGPPLVRRRTAVAGTVAGVAAALLSGCDNGEEIAPPESSGRPSPVPASPTADDRSPDELLVDEVLAALAASVGVLARARRAPALRTPLTAVLRAHRRHVLVLEGEPDAPGDGDGSGAPDAATALRRVRRSERELQVTLVDAARRAESGALARLLASMSASVTQHLSLLPPEVAS